MHRQLIGIILASLLLTACGQKGPLYLPQDEPAPNRPATKLL
jgi:predicted small lipoprotein YifL